MLCLATWRFGRIAARAALREFASGGSALDAAVAGAQAVEDDPSVMSVGYGGLGNAAGTVQLDACVMEGTTLSCGAVAGLENMCHPAAVARRVMERTPHVLLVGEGARLFAVREGFSLENLNTPQSVAEWRRRKQKQPRTSARIRQQRQQQQQQNAESKSRDPLTHDTVAVLTCDAEGRLAGACSTSGLSHKLPGRVGDSPLIGIGLYVDDQAGAAAATGVGEEVIRAGGVVSIVELLRQGRTPQEACEAMIARVNRIAARRGVRPAEIGVLALNSQGETGAACTRPTDFAYAFGRGSKVSVRRGVKIFAIE
ncbi:MAG TPA: isoaspartyl peptidase/L-asparaginase [Pirellulales bacterium]|nr:isoaspartyl peptidase/L-asparaginase [Pirellulales bacterium]